MSHVELMVLGAEVEWMEVAKIRLLVTVPVMCAADVNDSDSVLV